MEFEVSLPLTPEPATCLCPEPEQSNLHLISLTCILILSSHLQAGFQVVPSFQVFPHPHVYQKYLMYFNNTCSFIIFSWCLSTLTPCAAL